MSDAQNCRKPPPLSLNLQNLKPRSGIVESSHFAGGIFLAHGVVSDSLIAIDIQKLICKPFPGQCHHCSSKLAMSSQLSDELCIFKFTIPTKCDRFASARSGVSLGIATRWRRRPFQKNLSAGNCTGALYRMCEVSYAVAIFLVRAAPLFVQLLFVSVSCGCRQYIDSGLFIL